VKRKTVNDQNSEKKPYVDGVAEVFMLVCNDHCCFRIEECAHAVAQLFIYLRLKVRMSISCSFLEHSKVLSKEVDLKIIDLYYNDFTPYFSHATAFLICNCLNSKHQIHTFIFQYLNFNFRFHDRYNCQANQWI